MTLLLTLSGLAGIMILRNHKLSGIWSPGTAAACRQPRRVRPEAGLVTLEKAPTYGLPLFVRRLIETTSRQQQAQRTLLDWPRLEYGIAKPSNNLVAGAKSVNSAACSAA